MKVTLSALLILGSCSVALGSPTTLPKRIEEEVEIVPLEHHNPYGDQPIIDTGFGGFGGFSGPFSNPFSGLLENLEGIMNRMRQQMDTLLKRFPVVGSNNNSSSEEIPHFPVAGLPPFQFDEIDLGKGNTTSVTKVIDGHKVVINETEYKKDDNFGGTFFKIRIIDVKPDSSELPTEKDSEEVTTQLPTKDRESLENSVENEISKSREATNFDNIETFDDVDGVQPFGKFSFTNRDTEWNDVIPIEPFEDNTLSFDEPQHIRPIDLHGDTRVNQIMADAGAPTNPDAEFIYDTRHPQYQNVKQFEPFINPR